MTSGPKSAAEIKILLDQSVTRLRKEQCVRLQVMEDRKEALTRGPECRKISGMYSLSLIRLKEIYLLATSLSQPRHVRAWDSTFGRLFYPSVIFDTYSPCSDGNQHKVLLCGSMHVCIDLRWLDYIVMWLYLSMSVCVSVCLSGCLFHCCLT